MAVERQAATGDDAVDVRMKGKLASPGVQHAGEAETYGSGEEACILGERLERCGHAFDEQVEEKPAVTAHQIMQLRRQRKDDVEIVRR